MTVMKAALIILTVLCANEDVSAMPNCHGIEDSGSTVTTSVDVESTTTPSPDFDEPCYCPDVYDPVFASNGVRYSNKCQFNCAQRKNEDIYIVS